MTASAQALEALLALMARLRDRERGCPWDRAQSFATIAPYTIEEAYEVADAVESGDPERIRDELGDLLFQVVFHARMAEERGWFDFAQVATGIHDKLVRRHPHVFREREHAHEGAAGALAQQWEEHKQQERQAAAQRRGHESGALEGVPRALPALTRAVKLGRRAGRLGFDWPHAEAVRAKLIEELQELDAALKARPPEAAGAAPDAAVAEELGDLLFALANWSRHLHVDPENALRAANAKFERRFAHMERTARERGLTLQQLSAQEWDLLWREAKRACSA